MSSSHEWPAGEYSSRNGWTGRPTDIDKLAPALVKAQGMVEGAVKGSQNPHLKNKYANLSAVWDACREALQKNGLAVMQLPCKAPAGHIGLTTILIHESGQSISDTFYMPLKDPTNPQAAGSALTYARRYALSSAIGICPEDDDGEAAKRGQVAPKASPPAAVDWNKAIAEAAGNKDKMKEVFFKLRNSSMDEADKTALLTGLGNAIKGMK